MENSKQGTNDERLPGFDPDLSPDNPRNIQVAEAHGLHYDPAREAYCDPEGCPVRDRFGQYLG
ncbi:MAG: hypothetical protein AAB367_00360 [Patescibacteria group bacterium]